MLYELGEIIDQTYKRTHIVYILRNWPSLDGLNFLGIRANTSLIHYVAQVLNLLLSEARLCFTNEKLFSFKHFEHQTHMRLMFRFGLRENQDVIDVNNNKLPDIRMKDRIHHSLKGRRSIRETFNQNLKLEMTKGCTERRLRPILFRNQYLMITRCQIQRREVSTSRHSV